jgi:hypothetical protein
MLLSESPLIELSLATRCSPKLDSRADWVLNPAVVEFAILFEIIFIAFCWLNNPEAAE